MHTTTFALAFAVGISTSCHSFPTVVTGPVRKNDDTRRTALSMMDEDNVGVNRRSFLGTTSAGMSFFLASPASARDEIFKPNPLTNSALEQVSSPAEMCFLLIGFVSDRRSMDVCYRYEFGNRQKPTT